MRAALIAVVAPFALLTVRWLSGMNAPVCPSDVPRPWAIDSFEARTAEVVPAGTSGGPDPWPLFERVVVDPGETTEIPGPGRWSVRLGSWRAPGTTWLDPVSGEPMDRVFEGDQDQATVTAAFEFILDFDAQTDVSTLERKLKAALPIVFDRRTGVPVTSPPELQVTGKRAHLVFPSGLAHRTALLLELPVSLPQLVRLQFELPPPPLPVVADLAELPAPNVPKRPWTEDFTARYYEQLGQRMQILLDGTRPMSSQSLPNASTCGEALERHLELNGHAYERTTFRAVRPSPGFLERVKHHIKIRLP